MNRQVSAPRQRPKMLVEAGEQRIRARISVQEWGKQGCIYKERAAGERGHFGASPVGPWAKQETKPETMGTCALLPKTFLSYRNFLSYKFPL